MSGELRHRQQQKPVEADAGAGFAAATPDEPHPAGPIKHGPITQAFRIAAFILYVLSSCIAIHLAQIIGAPLYFIHKGYYYSYMAVTKQFFGIVGNTITQWFCPTIIRVSGDASMRGQMKLAKDGRLETEFPNRLILIANHQLYTDWLYLWWISYTSSMHGQIYIILKESLKYFPIIGPGMMFYGFIFMARNWTKDKPRMQYRLEKLKTRQQVSRHSPPGSLDPMWLFIFPEGTNLSGNTRGKSKAFADKAGLQDMKHQLLPRSTGLHFCLDELKGTVDWVYDCTIAYEGIPHGQYGQDIYTLNASCFQGRAPPSVNMYWRRFAVSSIPTDSKAFEQWLRDRWIEKDTLMEQYLTTGRFPADDGADYTATGALQTVQGAAGSGNDQQGAAKEAKLGPGGYRYLETEVRNRWSGQWMLVYLPVTVFAVLAWGLYRLVTSYL